MSDDRCEHWVLSKAHSRGPGEYQCEDCGATFDVEPDPPAIRSEAENNLRWPPGWPEGQPAPFGMMGLRAMCGEREALQTRIDEALAAADGLRLPLGPTTRVTPANSRYARLAANLLPDLCAALAASPGWTAQGSAPTFRTDEQLSARLITDIDKAEVSFDRKREPAICACGRPIENHAPCPPLDG